MTELLIWSGVPRVAARANWGRWIADCPRCTSALTLPPGRPTLECWDCGARAEVEWPAPEFVAGVERLLSMRPLVNTRNWQPGEDLHDLLQENVEHGVMNPLALEAATSGRTLLAISGDRIDVDLLPQLPNRLQITPSARAALEA